MELQITEGQQAIEDLTEVVSSELPLTTRETIVPEAVLPEPPQVLTPEDFGTAVSYIPTFIIDNYKDYNISDLRSFFKVDKYLEDPVAFMKNYVWSPNFKGSGNSLTFDYRLPKETDVNRITKLAIDKSIERIEQEKLTSVDEIREVLIKVVGDTAINFITGPKQTEEQLELIENYFWFWCSQIFSYNTLDKTGDKLILRVDENSAPALVIASLALHDYYVEQSNKKINALKVFLKNAPVGVATALNFLLNLQVPKRIYSNKNNYLKLKDPSLIESLNTVNYINSPFFNNNLDNMSESEKKFFSTPKEVKKCKNTIEGKIETGLRLFYKEGNDNILDKKVPKGGLGCQTSVLSWDEARVQIFDIDSVKSNNLRVNLSLPYYNELNIKNNTAIPKQIDIEQSLIGTAIPTDIVKSIKRETYLSFAKKELEDVLIDKNLLGELDEASTGYFNAFIKYSNPVLNNTSLPANFAPYLGQFSLGNVIEKQSTETDPSNIDKQKYFIIDNIAANDNFVLYDSQVKYGTKYKYSLDQLIQQVRYQYQYGISLKPLLNNQIEFAAKVVQADTQQRLKRLKRSEVDTDFSFIDLPPLPTFLEVFPIAGVNNKLIFTFENLADSGVITRTIPQEYWTDGWQQAKEYYEKLNPEITDSIKNQVYFFKQVLQKIKIYSSKVPPKDLNSLKLFKEVDVLSEGYGSIVDLEPNTKYYFAIKSESYTGLESYFSEIYEVEIVDDGGTVFPIVQLYDSLSNEVKRKSQLDFGEKFRIEPALLQQAPNPDKDGIGYLNPTVFSKINETRAQFKIRLTSKKTGKKVDFNIIYKKDFQKASENAGSLNLKETTKDKVLISYKTKEE
jgi:hypothetical protein